MVMEVGKGWMLLLLIFVALVGADRPLDPRGNFNGQSGTQASQEYISNQDESVRHFWQRAKSLRSTYDAALDQATKYLQSNSIQVSDVPEAGRCWWGTRAET